MTDLTRWKDEQPTGRLAGRVLRSFVLACALSGVLPGATAWAHKMVVFATVQGQAIHGEVYYQDGTPAQQVTLSVLGPDDVALGSATTDAKGEFVYQPQSRCLHRFVADGGFGHRAEYTVPVEQLPPDLAASSGQQATSPVSPTPATSRDSRSDSADGSHRELAGEIQALNRQIVALREELEKWKAALRIQDVLGGVGYILGILGIASYFLAGRRRERSATTKA